MEEEGREGWKTGIPSVCVCVGLETQGAIVQHILFGCPVLFVPSLDLSQAGRRKRIPKVSGAVWREGNDKGDSDKVVLEGYTEKEGEIIPPRVMTGFVREEYIAGELKNKVLDKMKVNSYTNK